MTTNQPTSDHIQRIEELETEVRFYRLLLKLFIYSIHADYFWAGSDEERKQDLSAMEMKLKL